MAWPAAAQAAGEVAVLREQVAALKAQVAAMEQRIDAMTAAKPAPIVTLAPASPPTSEADTATSWKGSPQFTRGDQSFKAKGRIQLDTGYVTGQDALNDKGLGVYSEFRRIRLGGEGRLGSGFGFKLEVELSDNRVDLVDSFITYERGRWLLTLGNQNQFQSLDELTGDTSGAVMERAAFTDAFNFERRLGLSAQFTHGAVLLQGGVFTDDPTALSNDSDGPAGGDENDSASVDGRIVYAPAIGDARLHLAASGHLRRLNRTADAPTRYRQRPYLHGTNTRILATPNLSVDEELNYGLEAALIRGRWWAAGETNWLTASRPGLPDPTFFGAYAEVGYFLTAGDSRAYRGGLFDRNPPKAPLGQGGIGSVQATLRYDYLDLTDSGVVGGRQDGLIVALVWTPVHFLRFNANYAHMIYGDTAVLKGGRRDYSLDVVGLRAELDF